MREGEWRLVAVRGATTVEEDTAPQIGENTGELLEEMMERNGIRQDTIVSIIFTATPDLVSDFPAVAARNLGLSQVPLLCSQEIPVTGSVERCVRVLMHVYTIKPRSEIRHVYLRGARQLRTDLPE
ncbi:MAG: chorismate mutase [Actinobacteria bacterium]|nr:chorismate mutase [Actinomycetota bacterium]MCL5882698.1 chorismate mutase [Actinomycetota bacterium]